MSSKLLGPSVGSVVMSSGVIGSESLLSDSLVSRDLTGDIRRGGVTEGNGDPPTLGSTSLGILTGTVCSEIEIKSDRIHL
jgi:hypothetical protein